MVGTMTSTADTPTPAPFQVGSDNWPGVAKLLEEVGELNQVLGKLIATEGDPAYFDGTDLEERLHEELGDVLAAIVFVMGHNGTRLDRHRINDRAAKKGSRLRRWRRESRR